MAKLKKTIMSLFLDKKARAALDRRPLVRQAIVYQESHNIVQDPPPQTATQPHPEVEEITERLSQAEQEMEKKRSPERLELIQEAMKIRNKQAKMLDALSEDQRSRLQEIAVNSFLNGGKD